MALCAFQIVVPSSLMPEFNHVDICNLAIQTGHGEMTIASAFALYLLTSDRVCEGPLCHEIWDFLLSTLAAIVDRDIPEEVVPLALLTCSAVCAALKKLICSLNPFIRRNILSSPWTVSIGMALRSVFEDELHPLPYFEELNKKLGEIGKNLLKSIFMGHEDIPESQRPDVAVDDSNSSVKTGIRLLYYRGDSNSGLLLIYDIKK
ncbi:hypothetical protein GALMADRAFT_324392 [Galerina marginata CBS 339.88]|uniref:Uncharacterized protein n=1 Tax=Galerina marginata (strain CBS 339.88) TaxID=685588 RepID=A0A067U1B0_GALM3|nr:hypothetical protein GALMADRAFT_324392 [Galerina marginata CBS 339.88]